MLLSCNNAVSETESLTERARIKQLGQAVHWPGKVITVTRQQLPEDAPFPFNMKQDWVTDSTYIRQTLGYCERVPQAEAMQQTIAWQRSHYPDDIRQSASAIALFDEAYEDHWINQP
ncbi:MAG: hypothetical protein AAFY26_22725 [Cyanobacteria bacterium J06638_22]